MMENTYVIVVELICEIHWRHDFDY